MPQKLQKSFERDDTLMPFAVVTGFDHECAVDDFSDGKRAVGIGTGERVRVGRGWLHEEECSISFRLPKIVISAVADHAGTVSYRANFTVVTQVSVSVRLLCAGLRS